MNYYALNAPTCLTNWCYRMNQPLATYRYDAAEWNPAERPYVEEYLEIFAEVEQQVQHELDGKPVPWSDVEATALGVCMFAAGFFVGKGIPAVEAYYMGKKFAEKCVLL